MVDRVRAPRVGTAGQPQAVLRVMRDGPPAAPATAPPRKRPGFFRVERPRQLWHMDMTSIWVAEHGWCYLNAIIDCCTREIVGCQLDLRCRAEEAIAVVEQAAVGHDRSRASWCSVPTTAPPSPPAASAPGLRARDPPPPRRLPRPREPGLHRELVRETQRTGGLAERVRDPRRRTTRIGGYIDRYHHRPHAVLNYRTPDEVRQTWEDRKNYRNTAA